MNVQPASPKPRARVNIRLQVLRYFEQHPRECVSPERLIDEGLVDASEHRLRLVLGWLCDLGLLERPKLGVYRRTRLIAGDELVQDVELYSGERGGVW